MAASAGGETYDVHALRGDIQEYLYNTPGISSSKRDQICAIWDQKEMEGELCKPGTPSLSASFIGCNSLPPFPGVFSFFGLEWSDSAHTDYFECQKRTPGNGWQAVSLNSSGDTEIVQPIGGAGSADYRVRGCNSSECGSYSNTQSISQHSSCDECASPLGEAGERVLQQNYTYPINNPVPRNIDIQFEAFEIPDELTVRANGANGAIIASTSGPRSGLFEATVAYDPAVHGNQFHVTVSAPVEGTAWQLCIDCPGGDCDSSNTPLQAETVSYSFVHDFSSWDCPASLAINGQIVPDSGSIELTVGTHAFSMVFDYCACNQPSGGILCEPGPYVNAEGQTGYFAFENPIYITVGNPTNPTE